MWFCSCAEASGVLSSFLEPVAFLMCDQINWQVVVLRTSQNHNMVEIGRDPWRSSGPAPTQSWPHRLPRTTFRWLLFFQLCDNCSCFVPTVNKVDWYLFEPQRPVNMYMMASRIVPRIMPRHWFNFKCVVFQESQTHVKHVLPCTGREEGDERDRDPTWVALLRSYPESPTFRTRISSPLIQSLGLCSCQIRLFIAKEIDR